MLRGLIQTIGGLKLINWEEFWEEHDELLKRYGVSLPDIIRYRKDKNREMIDEDSIDEVKDFG